MATLAAGPAHECLFGYATWQGRAVGWLRLVQRGEQVGAVVSDVPGEAEPGPLPPGSSLVWALESRFALAPGALSLLYHAPLVAGQPPECWVWGRSRATWGYTSPERMGWLWSDPDALEAEWGGPLPLRPFWRTLRGPRLRGAGCQVGARQGWLWQVAASGPWAALVSDPPRPPHLASGFKEQAEARRWLVARLAALAREWDGWPEEG